jgi:small conductance mechanosensitive channel
MAGGDITTRNRQRQSIFCGGFSRAPQMADNLSKPQRTSRTNSALASKSCEDRIMLFGVLGHLVILAQLAAPLAAGAGADPLTVVKVANPTTHPTTQASALEITVKTESTSTTQPTETAASDKIDIIKVIEGKQILTADQLLKFGPWIGAVTELAWEVISFIPKLIVAVFIFFIFWLVYRAIRKIIRGAMKTAGVDESIRDMLLGIVKWTVLGFGLIVCCNQLGIPIVAMLTGVSIIGLAVGFAAQETLANFIAGIVIFWDRPFKLGDWVEVDGTFGQVQRITFRSTRLLNLDGETIVFPNTHMLANRVANHSAHPINRVNIAIGIAYKSSIDQARSILLGLIANDTRICSEPPPSVVVNECGDSSVNLLFRFWIKDEAIERSIRYEYLEKAKKAFDSNGIEIPFPHMQLLVDKPAVVNAAA